jgi:hypothetical protein
MNLTNVVKSLLFITHDLESTQLAYLLKKTLYMFFIQFFALLEYVLITREQIYDSLLILRLQFPSQIRSKGISLLLWLLAPLLIHFLNTVLKEQICSLAVKLREHGVLKSGSQESHIFGHQLFLLLL